MTPVRLKDVAKEVGVSVGAVGWVLNGTGTSTISVGPATAERIREAASRLGYRVNYAARQLRGGRSGIIGIVTKEGDSEEDMRRLISIEQEAASEGLHVMVATLDATGSLKKQVSEAFQRFSTRGVDGVVVLSWDLLSVDKKYFWDMPVVFVGPPKLMKDRAGVTLDASEGGRVTAEHLLAQGKRRIGFALQEHAFAHTRIKGSEDVLKEHGLTLDPACIFIRVDDHFGNEQMAEEAVHHLVVEQKVDAIIAENDHWAARIHKVLRRRGIEIPEQVALVGYNNLRFCEYMEPPITSLEEREDDIAAAAIDAVQQLISKSDSALEPHVIKPHLVVRAST